MKSSFAIEGKGSCCLIKKNGRGEMPGGELVSRRSFSFVEVDLIATIV
jgi:hypothetical protein